MKRYLLLLSLLFTLHAHARTGRLYDGDNQLSSSFVTNIYQDKDGFMWIATRNGLNRYDGYQFKTLKKEHKTYGLSSNYINCVCQDRKGTLYIGTNLTVQRMENGRFADVRLLTNDNKPVRTYITDLLETHDGTMLFSSSGYGIFRLNGNVARPIEALRTVNYVSHIMEDSHNRLWIVSEDQGLLCLDGKRLLRYFTRPGERELVKGGDIGVDRQGNVYVGIKGMGLWCMAKGGKQFTKIAATGNLPIVKVYINRAGQVMLGCDGSGLYVYIPERQQLVSNPYYDNIDLSKTKVQTIVEDRSGNIWLGLFQKGVYMQPSTHSDFGYMGPKSGANVIGNNCVTAVLRDKTGHIWVGTDRDGLYLLDKDHRLVRHYATTPSTILSLTEDRLGRIWTGSYQQGCGWVTAGSAIYHPVNLEMGERPSIFGITTDPKGNLWFASMGQGLACLDIRNYGIKHYRQLPGAGFDRKMNSIPNDYLNKVVVSRDGRRVYVAGAVGLSCLDLTAGSWTDVFGTNCPNYNTFSRVLLEDRSGRVWLGTNDGLYCYDIKARKHRLFTMQNGLPDNGIACIEQDSRGRLWVGTDHGLCCMTTEGNVLACYYANNGLQSNEFSDGASYISDGRYLLLGGTAGINWFDTARKTDQSWTAKVMITGLIVGNQQQNIGINDSNIRLKYEDNSFSIQLSTLTYDDPDNITYLYSINKEAWVRLQPGMNEIMFSHLSPGNYTFRVKAMYNNMPSEVKAFTVEIEAPWYRSAPAYMVYLLTIVALICLFYRYQKRKTRDRMRLQAHMHAEEMGEAKLRFFMNISHEIRTPMTLIISPLLQLMKEDTDLHRQGIYTTIKRNAERILHLINQLMDLRKIDKGMLAMHMQKTDLVGFIDDVYALFKEQAKAKNIDFRFGHDGQLSVWIDRRNFDKVLVNIISNAFKYTPTGGNIAIRLSQTDTEARITISDNGEKIPEEKLKRIFERFYQADTKTNDEHIGTGIGLDLARSIVELHYGNIEARNLENERGCAFVVTLPLGNSHLKPEEMMDTETEKDGHIDLDESQTSLETAGQEGETGGKHRPSLNEQLSNRKRQTIVIAEDDDEISHYLQTELGRNFHVIACDNGREALDVILKKLPALVITDLMMPVMNGNELCAKIKANVNTNHIPVIMLTAKNRDEDRLEGLETGADAYIVKPFNMDILRRTVFNMLHQRELLRNKFNGSQTQEGKIKPIALDSPDEKLMGRILNVINANISVPDLNTDMIAREVGISRVHLHRKMKELTNQTPHTFIRNTRLQQAARLLQKSGQNITEVMYACGFTNSASFSTMFKNLYGMSPRDYMKK